jgi:hypothetical protein
MRIPQAIHVGFAESERAVRQYPAVDLGIVHLDVPGLVAVEADAGVRGESLQYFGCI